MIDLDALIELIEAAKAEHRQAGWHSSRWSKTSKALERLGLDFIDRGYVLRKVYGPTPAIGIEVE